MTGFKAEPIKNLTVPMLKLEVDIPAYVRITGAIYTGKPLRSRASEADAAKKPPQIAPIDNLTNGDHMLMIVPAALEGTLADSYDGTSYVGKCFELIKRPKVTGKSGLSYSPFSVVEIKDPNAATKAK